jgi:hypothetical protein
MKSEVRMSRFHGRRGVLFGLMLLGCSFMLGCGGGGGGGAKTESSADEREIRALVGGVSDKATELNRLRESFTAAAAPKQADLKKFSTHMFSIAGPVNVSGTTASFTVTIAPYAEGTAVEKPWKATKEGSKWLLSEAPLP